MSVLFDAAYAGLNAIFVTVPITVVVAMVSAAMIHAVAKAVVALGLGKVDAEPASGPVLVDDETAIAVAVAVAKRYHDTH
ncbi:MAG: hypothetical protein OER43_18215 [Gammaproteobacteria bacterium]|nr:hypothetical protein [Gammaproteobacteria bacterium]MDH3413900.1 hypothetical protein [Gammaproteobacteria bacterium]